MTSYNPPSFWRNDVRKIESMITSLMPVSCSSLLEQLNEAGYKAYVVGGCIRDILMDKSPSDWDITTSATPNEMKEVLSNDFDFYNVGEEHGTIVFKPKNSELTYEVTTFRIDGSYSDGRRPDEVTFTGDLMQDLARRDFTMNAIAFSIEDGIVDPYGGIHDVEHKVIKCVGNPYNRFDEDPLRILRAVRFSATLGFEIDLETWMASKSLANRIHKISRERISGEFIKMMNSRNPRWISSAIDSNRKVVFNALEFEEFEKMKNFDQNSKYHDRNIWTHSLDVLAAIDNNSAALRIAALFHDVGKVSTASVGEDGYNHYYGHEVAGEKLVRAQLKKMKMSNDFINEVCFYISEHDKRPSGTKKCARKFIYKCEKNEEVIENLFCLMHADICAHKKEYVEDWIKELDKAYVFVCEAWRDEDCFSLKDLKIDGDKLLENGFEQGKQIGECLNYLLEQVLNGLLRNEELDLITAAKWFKVRDKI